MSDEQTSQTAQTDQADPNQEQAPEPPRLANGRFLAGHSGNPGGRAKRGRQCAQLARTHTRDAINVLAQIMHDDSEPSKVRVSAANSLLDRGWGRPPVQVETPAVKPIDQMDRDELAELLGTTREQIDQMMERAESSGEQVSIAPRIVLEAAKRQDGADDQS